VFCQHATGVHETCRYCFRGKPACQQPTREQVPLEAKQKSVAEYLNRLRQRNIWHLFYALLLHNDQYGIEYTIEISTVNASCDFQGGPTNYLLLICQKSYALATMIEQAHNHTYPVSIITIL